VGEAAGDDEPCLAAAHEQLTDGQQEAHDDEDVVSTEQNTNIVALGFRSGWTMLTSEQYRTYAHFILRLSHDCIHTGGARN
jgi:hypothetical protein